MSFRCQGCGKCRQKPRVVVTKTREHTHVELREGEYGKLEPMIVGTGPQIVEEKKVCDSCI